MRWLRSVIALGIALALGLAARQFAAPPVATTSARRPFVPTSVVDPERVIDVILERDGVRYRFVRRGESWWQTEPIEFPVDSWSIRQFVIRLLKTESVRSVPADPESLSRAGLSPAVASIELTILNDDGVSRTVGVELGKRSLAGRAYARMSDANATFDVVDATLHEFVLERDPKEFRRRDIFVDLSEVDRVAFNSGGKLTVLERTGRDYRLSAPVRARADRAQAEELLDALRRARSGGFIVDRPAELAVYGLAPAAATITVDGAGNTQTLLIGDAVSIGAQDRFGMMEGSQTIVRLPAAEIAGIVPRVERLLDAVATGVRPRDVGGLEIVSGANRVVLHREVEGWTARLFDVSRIDGADAASKEPRVVDTDAVDRLLSALCEARAGSVEIADFPADREVARITLLGFAGEPIDTVRVARRASDDKLILENGDGVLRIHGAIDLPLEPAALGLMRTR